jgi:hypothetical protein
MPNLPDVIEIGYSRKRLLVLLAGAIILRFRNPEDRLAARHREGSGAVHRP